MGVWEGIRTLKDFLRRHGAKLLDACNRFSITGCLRRPAIGSVIFSSTARLYY